ncbi:MAG: SUMF1/EgtB/PvdO family nonheme iron enzyme [Acidobacteria bacterium]|nr:SUMF1/EgtB/PvdO family nonheme iron enzyme [Acidobacteriota bacterium]
MLVGNILAVFGLWAGSQVLAQSPSTEMVTIPAGPFLMGSDDGPADERPAHRIDLPAFQIDRTPTTNAQFTAFLNAVGPQGTGGALYYDAADADARIHQRGGRWVADTGFENHPVVEVSWFGAKAYCAWAGKRLPTEAEWEKAARGTEGRKYPWGDPAPDLTRAQFNAGWSETVPVGGFPRWSTPYGVLDMAGNAWEWVSSAYRSYPYNPADGREALNAGPVRGTRGGGHDSPPEELTTTYRGRNLSREPQAGHHNISFRCAR